MSWCHSYVMGLLSLCYNNYYFPRGAPINTASSTSMTPLKLAALNGHEQVSIHYTPRNFVEMSTHVVLSMCVAMVLEDIIAGA